MLLLGAGRPSLAEGPYVGIDAGVSIPTNDNYRAHVHEGGMAAPFVGFMFSEYVGIQTELPVFFRPADNDHRPQPDLDGPSQWTTIMGLSVGPRLSLPLNEVVSLYALQGRRTVAGVRLWLSIPSRLPEGAAQIGVGS